MNSFKFSSTPKGEVLSKFCDYLVKSDKRFMVEAHCCSAKHQRGLFHEEFSERGPNFLNYVLQF